MNKSSGFMLITALWILLIINLLMIVAYQGVQTAQWRTSHSLHAQQARLAAESALLIAEQLIRENVFVEEELDERLDALDAITGSGGFRTITLDSERHIHARFSLDFDTIQGSAVRITAVSAYSIHLPPSPTALELDLLFSRSGPYASDPHYVRQVQTKSVYGPKIPTP